MTLILKPEMTLQEGGSFPNREHRHSFGSLKLLGDLSERFAYSPWRFGLTESFLREYVYLKAGGWADVGQWVLSDPSPLPVHSSSFPLGTSAFLLLFLFSAVSSLLGSHWNQVSPQGGVCSFLSSLGSQECSLEFYTRCFLLLVDRKWYLLLFRFAFSSSKILRRKWRQNTVWSGVLVLKCTLWLEINAFWPPFLSLTPLAPQSSPFSLCHLSLVFVIAPPFSSS